MTDVTMRQMLEAGVHFGHQTRFWHPRMRPYIFGERNRIHIIDLEKTVPLFSTAMRYLQHLSANGGSVLFVGTKGNASDLVREEATRAGAHFVDRRWLGGMLTNYRTVRRSIERLKLLDTMLSDGSSEKFTKKEKLTMTRERDKLGASLGGIRDMDGLPDALFIIDVGHEYIAVAEAKRLGIPVVGVVDTNRTPDGVDYIIPGNDDAARAIQLYVQAAADAVLAGRAQRQERQVGGDDEFVEVSPDGMKGPKKARIATTTRRAFVAPEEGEKRPGPGGAERRPGPGGRGRRPGGPGKPGAPRPGGAR